MDLRKGPNLYFDPNEQTRTRTTGATQTQVVNLNTMFKDNQSYDTKKPIPYTSEYVANYNNANSIYRKNNNGENLYKLKFDGNKATNKDLFVKPLSNPLLEALAGVSGNFSAPEPSYYREIKESRGGQSHLSSMNTMRGDSKHLK